MNKDEYYDWIAENDSYPEHSHKWIVGLYTPDGGRFDMLHRYFGPFETKEQARVFAADYKDKYTKPGFISRTKIFPLCEVVKDT
jgi:hypothetical protein